MHNENDKQTFIALTLCFLLSIMLELTGDKTVLVGNLFVYFFPFLIVAVQHELLILINAHVMLLVCLWHVQCLLTPRIVSLSMMRMTM